MVQHAGENTASWKIENEKFRRLARTGEFAPEVQPAEQKLAEKPVTQTESR